MRWPDAPTLAGCHKALDGCFAGDAHGMVEHIKSFIECACETIICEFRGSMLSSTPSTTELLVAALSALGLRNSRGASKLDKLLSGFNKLADALAEMRNEHGPVAHGKDAFLDAITTDHARAFLYAGDAILGVLLTALEGKEPDLMVTREPYERFEHLNQQIDRAISVDAWIDEDGDRPLAVFSVATGLRSEAIEIRVEPSKLLYGIDRAAYVEVLRTVSLVTADSEKEESESETPIDVVPQAFQTVVTSGPLVKRVARYSGPLEVLRRPLEAFLASESLGVAAETGEDAPLLDSLLATAEQNMGLDWKLQESLLARLKVACRRILVQFGTKSEKAEGVTERLVAWLLIQAPDSAVQDAEKFIEGPSDG